MLIFQGVNRNTKKARIKKNGEREGVRLGIPFSRCEGDKEKYHAMNYVSVFNIYTPLEVGDITIKLFQEESSKHQ